MYTCIFPYILPFIFKSNIYYTYIYFSQIYIVYNIYFYRITVIVLHGAYGVHNVWRVFVSLCRSMCEACFILRVPWAWCELPVCVLSL